MSRAGIAHAEALEAEASDFPEERGEILLEAAEAWQRAGRPERAREILVGLLDLGGDDACFAQVHLAGLDFAAGGAEAARARLAALAKDRALDETHCVLAAELLAEHGELAQAARWYDRAAARLPEEEMDALRGYGGDVSMSTVMVLQNRRHVREQLGRVPDLLDELVPERLSGPVSPAAPEAPGQVRTLVFQRDQRRLARQRWPGTDAAPDDDYYRARERDWRTGHDRGAPSVAVVPAQVDALTAFAARAGGSPTDADVRRRYCDSIPARDTINWPPERNAACWCGSGHKYKKCCGRPG